MDVDAKSFKMRSLGPVLLVSLLICLVFPAVDIGWIYPAFEKRIIENVETDAARLASYISDAVIGQHKRLTPRSFTLHDAATLRRIAGHFMLVKLKIFSNSGQVVFSTDAGEVGDLNRNSYFHEIVAQGDIFSKVVRKATATMEGQRLESDVVETYVPIMRGRSFAGAFEIYYDITARTRRLDKLLSRSTTLISIMAACLFTVICLMVIRGGRIAAESRKTQLALKESEAAYRSIMASMTDCIYICSPDFTVEYMNPAMIQRTGYDATGESCHESVHGLAQKCDYCAHHRVQQGEHLSTEVVSSKDGRVYLVSHCPIRHEDQSVSKLTIFRDITEKKRMEEELLKVKKLESMAILSGGMAHEFNNILASIVGYTELAKEDADQRSILRSNLEEVLTASQRAKTLIEQMCVMSAQSGADIKPIEIGPVIGAAAEIAMQSVPEGVTMACRLLRDGYVSADRGDLQLIIDNLCSNAIKAMPAHGGALTLELDKIRLTDDILQKFPDLAPGWYMTLEVTDTGHGISDEDLPKIFDPFFTTREPGEGTGLGLSMVHFIVERYGGKALVDSKVNRGTTVRILLPVCPQGRSERGKRVSRTAVLTQGPCN